MSLMEVVAVAAAPWRNLFENGYGFLASTLGGLPDLQGGFPDRLVAVIWTLITVGLGAVVFLTAFMMLAFIYIAPPVAVLNWAWKRVKKET